MKQDTCLTICRLFILSDHGNVALSDTKTVAPGENGRARAHKDVDVQCACQVEKANALHPE